MEKNTPHRILGSSKIQETVNYTDSSDGSLKKVGSSFFRGDGCRFNPHKDQMWKADSVERYLLDGWLPSEPVIDQSTVITAFGSCFASNISKFLSKRGYDLSTQRNTKVYISRMGEGMVNTYSLLSQFEWAFRKKVPEQPLWHGYKGEDFGYDERIRKQTKKIFMSTEFFILTLGLSEVWYDEISNDVFWRAIPLEHYDPSRHKFRVTSVAENKKNIAKIYKLIRRYVPNAKVLFTLSPVPLAATFRPVSCITANSVSKAILRSAVDEFVRENYNDVNSNLFYFPSYEIVNDYFPDRFMSDGRHPHKAIIDSIMHVFEAYYCRGGVTREMAGDVLLAARRKNILNEARYMKKTLVSSS